jgi:hypothetical protein
MRTFTCRSTFLYGQEYKTLPINVSESVFIICLWFFYKSFYQRAYSSLPQFALLVPAKTTCISQTRIGGRCAESPYKRWMFLIFKKYTFNSASSAAPQNPLCQRLQGLNRRLLQPVQWQSDAITIRLHHWIGFHLLSARLTRLDLLHIRLISLG